MPKGASGMTLEKSKGLRNTLFILTADYRAGGWRRLASGPWQQPRFLLAECDDPAPVLYLFAYKKVARRHDYAFFVKISAFM